MNVKERNEISVDFATRGVIETLENASTSTLGKCVVKADLFPRAAACTNALIYSEDNPVVEDDILPEITVEFINNNWQKIRLLAAGVYQKYIIPHSEGVYLGTFKEYQTIPNDRMKSIAAGLQRIADEVADICEAQGGSTIRLDVQVRRLTDGNKTEGEE